MDKLPPRPDLPPQGTKASESKGKDAVGSDGRRGIRNQGANTNLRKPLSSSDVVKTALKDRLISKTSGTVARQSGVVIRNLSKTMAVLQRAVKACAEPGYRVSKSEAVISSIKALKSIRKQLGDTGQELQLKSQLNDLLGTKIARGRVNMTLSDFGQISKLANTVADAPTMARMEKKTAELLTRALELLTDSAYNHSPKEYTPPVTEQKAEDSAFIGDKLEELFPEGVMPDLDAVDDSEPVINAKTVPEEVVIPTPLPEEAVIPTPLAEKAVIPTPPPPPPLPEKAVIPTPPPPPPLPEEQVADVSGVQSELEAKAQLEARRGFDAVIEELKQKLTARGDPAQSRNPDIMTSSAQIPVDASVPWQAPDLVPVPKVDIKDQSVDSKELGQPKAGSFKTVAGQKRHFSSIDSTSSDGERPLKRLRHGEDSLMSTAPVNNAEARKAYGAVMDELKQKLSARGAPDTEIVPSSEQGVSSAPQQADLAKSNSAVHKKELPQKPPAQSKNPQVETSSAKGAVDTSEAHAMAKRAEASKGFDAVIEELKEKIRQRGGAFDPDLSPATEVVADVQARQATPSPEEQPDSATDEQMAALQEQAERNHADLKEALRARRMAIDPDDPDGQGGDEPERNKKDSGESGQ